MSQTRKQARHKNSTSRQFPHTSNVIFSCRVLLSFSDRPNESFRPFSFQKRSYISYIFSTQKSSNFAGIEEGGRPVNGRGVEKAKGVNVHRRVLTVATVAMESGSKGDRQKCNPILQPSTQFWDISSFVMLTVWTLLSRTIEILHGDFGSQA